MQKVLGIRVSAYLLKPVKFAELTKVLLSLKEKIENKRKAATAMTAYTSIKEEQIILSCSVTRRMINYYRKHTIIQQGLIGNYMLAILSVDNKNSLGESLLIFPFCCGKALKTKSPKPISK